MMLQNAVSEVDAQLMFVCVTQRLLNFDLKLIRQYLIINSFVLCTEIKVEILQCRISFKSVLH